MFGLQDGGWGGGYEDKKKSVYLKWASHFWVSVQSFIFLQRKFLLVLSGWVVWFGCVGPLDHPPPPWVSASLIWGFGFE